WLRPERGLAGRQLIQEHPAGGRSGHRPRTLSRQAGPCCYRECAGPELFCVSESTVIRGIYFSANCPESALPTASTFTRFPARLVETNAPRGRASRGPALQPNWPSPRGLACRRTQPNCPHSDLRVRARHETKSALVNQKQLRHILCLRPGLHPYHSWSIRSAT